MLAGIVFGLFGLMHALAAVAWALDDRARRQLLASLLRLRVRVEDKDSPEALWAWLFTLVRPSHHLILAAALRASQARSLLRDGSTKPALTISAPPPLLLSVRRTPSRATWIRSAARSCRSAPS